MADLSDKDSSQTVKLVGADPTTGIESSYVEATSNGLKVEATGNVASLATDSGNPIKVGAVHNTTLPTVTNGQRVDLQTNKFGELTTAPRNKYWNFAGAGTNTVKSGAGRLHTVAVNATANGTITIYDNTTATGTRIATCAITNGVSNPTFIYDVEFSTGLTIVTTGANLNITVSYW